LGGFIGGLFGFSVFSTYPKTHHSQPPALERPRARGFTVFVVFRRPPPPAPCRVLGGHQVRVGFSGPATMAPRVRWSGALSRNLRRSEVTM
jgi:hypothetical protein